MRIELQEISFEENFIRIFCEITGMGESAARCAFILHDALHGDGGIANMVARVPIPGNGAAPQGSTPEPHDARAAR